VEAGQTPLDRLGVVVAALDQGLASDLLRVRCACVCGDACECGERVASWREVAARRRRRRSRRSRRRTDDDDEGRDVRRPCRRPWGART
jgi:hypothetical protein